MRLRVHWQIAIEELTDGGVRSQCTPLRGAYSIFELVVVLLIVGIVGATAAPSYFRSLQYHQIESAARRLKHDLEYLQATARTQSSSLTMEFDEMAYTMGGEALQGLDRVEDYRVELGAAPYAVHNVDVNLGGQPAIVFNGYGETTHDATITLTVGSQTRTIQVVAATGAILSNAEH
jgi:type II secretory pathway pseudopilin PulG